jgi:hypothetical protein
MDFETVLNVRVKVAFDSPVKGPTVVDPYKFDDLENLDERRQNDEKHRAEVDEVREGAVRYVEEDMVRAIKAEYAELGEVLGVQIEEVRATE